MNVLMNIDLFNISFIMVSQQKYVLYSLPLWGLAGLRDKRKTWGAVVCRSQGWLCCRLAKAGAVVCCLLTTEMYRVCQGTLRSYLPASTCIDMQRFYHSLSPSLPLYGTSDVSNNATLHDIAGTLHLRP